MIQLVAHYTITRGRYDQAMEWFARQNSLTKETFDVDTRRFRPLAGPEPMNHVLSLSSFESLAVWQEFLEKRKDISDTPENRELRKGFIECFDGMRRGLYTPI